MGVHLTADGKTGVVRVETSPEIVAVENPGLQPTETTYTDLDIEQFKATIDQLLTEGNYRLAENAYGEKGWVGLSFPARDNYLVLVRPSKRQGKGNVLELIAPNGHSQFAMYTTEDLAFSKKVTSIIIDLRRIKAAELAAPIKKAA